MRTLLLQFWRDERGALGVEWAFIATLLVLGAVTGVIASRQVVLNDPDAAPAAQTRPAGQ
jgi:Flp pilus assembly pilin Flp